MAVQCRSSETLLLLLRRSIARHIDGHQPTSVAPLQPSRNYQLSSMPTSTCQQSIPAAACIVMLMALPTTSQRPPPMTSLPAIQQGEQLGQQTHTAVRLLKHSAGRWLRLGEVICYSHELAFEEEEFTRHIEIKLEHSIQSLTTPRKTPCRPPTRD